MRWVTHRNVEIKKETQKTFFPRLPLRGGRKEKYNYIVGNTLIAYGIKREPKKVIKKC